MAHRSPGDGTVGQRKDGRWQASIMVEGKRRTVYGSTRAEATRKLATLRTQASSGALPDPGRRTVADLISAWLEAAAPSLKPSTVASYEAIAERHALPAIGKVRLARLEPLHVQRLVSACEKAGTARTAQKVYALLHRACRLAVLWRWLPENPCDRILRPAYHATRRDLWTPDQLATFMKGIDRHWLEPLWVFLVVSGTRLGEALALEWADFDGTTVRICRTGQYVRRLWTVTEPKTRAGTRALALPPDGVAALRRQRAQQAQWRLRSGGGWADAGLVFTGETGKPLQGTVVAHAVQRACRALGLPPVTPHGPRHLRASLLLSQGVAVSAVSRRLGHASPGITMSVYAHAIERDEGEVVEAIGRALAHR